MGSIVSIPTIISLALISGGVLYGFLEKRPPPPAWNARSVTVTDSEPVSTTEKKKGKKKKGGKADDTPTQPQKAEPTPNVVAFPAVVPGAFESVTDTAAAETASKPKAKKKKAKKAGSATGGIGGGNRSIPLDAQSESSATAPESSTPVSRPTTKRRSPPVIDADGPWTRVESRKRNGAQPTPSDAGITTSVTGTSSPVAPPTEDEQSLDTEANRRTLAEKLLPKARRTGVEDMLQTPDVPTLARVMRVQPRPDEQPAVGFSWGDYEDVEESRGTADDADGEEDGGGWVVKGSRNKPRSTTSSVQITKAQAAPETLTKKQRQNLAKREAQKASKADAEAERLAALAKHKRELERLRMAEQSTSKKKQSGGMVASMNEKGHLVWD